MTPQAGTVRDSSGRTHRPRGPGAFCLLGVGAAALGLFLVHGRTMAQAGTQAARATTPEIRAVEVDEPGGQILSFLHLAGSTVVEMKGTKIEPRAAVKMKVESRPGFLEIDINRGEITGIQPARRFGADFLTYVLWAVSVDGQAQNLGEITFDATGPVSINVTTTLQTFWLMITAEPDFAVDDPSPVVVLYSINQDRVITSNKAQPVPGKLLYYTYYTQYDTSPAKVQLGVSNELLQARKAVELAGESGILAQPTPAGQEPLADEARTQQTLQQAREFLKQAEEAFGERPRAREVAQLSRTAVQLAENARALSLGAVGGINLRRLERELVRTREEAERLSGNAAEREKELASLRQRLTAMEAELEKEREAARRAVGDAQGVLDRERQATREAIARAEAAERRLAEVERLAEERARQLAALEQSFQDALRQIQRERDQICGELRRQLNALGQLTEQGGNLVLTLASDILFDFGSYELRPAARENLAKLAVVRLLLFPQAEVRYEGHTDRVGEDAYNQWLSEQRALAVYRYFLEESVRLRSASAGADEQRLAAVTQLLGMQYGIRSTAAQRQDLLARLGETVVGKGEREVVEDVPGPSEPNRRVVLLFPPAQANQMSALCAAPPQP